MRSAASPALSALLAAIHDRRATLPEPIVSLAEIVAREVGRRQFLLDLVNGPQPPEPHGARRTGGVADDDRPARDPADDHPLEWGLR